MSSGLRITVGSILTAIAFFVFVAPVAAATFTVTPGQSIQTAVNSAAIGDTVQIRAGTYYETVAISKSLKVIGYPGEQPIIDGQNIRSTGISVRGSNITVSNIKVINHTGHDVDIDGTSNSILDGLEVYVTGRAVHIQNSNNVTIKNSKITTPTYIAKQTDGIYSQRNKNNIYENNTIIIYNSHPDGHDDAIQMYLDESIIVRGNYLAQVNDKTSNAQGLYATTMHGTSRFYNNVVNLGNAQSNALSFRKLPELGGTGTVEIVGNTIVGARPYHGIWVTETENPIVKNNIVRLGSGAALTLSGSVAGVSNNLTTVDPKFVNSAQLDFRLQSGSPAIDTGVNLGDLYNSDKDGKSRPYGNSWDIGAFEYTQTSPPSSTPSPKPGDANTDGKVDEADYSVWISHYGQNVLGIANGDFNSDNNVSGVDYIIWLNNYGR